ncbi:MAG TPA: L,D-transpeptidase [Acidimicrobiia bacterium]|nr:L,D-transpeptidase [Acidimicrobiia bacterium]
MDLRQVLGTGIAAGLLVACSAATSSPLVTEPPTSLPTSTTTFPETPATTAPRTATSGSVTTIPQAETGQHLVARSRDEVASYLYPRSSDVVKLLPATTILGTPQVYLVERATSDGWVELALPGRPHGSTAWAEAAALDFEIVHQLIEVDLDSRTLRYLREGEEVFTTTATVGSPANPTPTGFFYVTDIVQLADANSPWGPYALGLSARSETITEFNGGDGIIGIHGTNRPSTIGEAVSLGCIRIDNDLITQLAAAVKLGTPVTIIGER